MYSCGIGCFWYISYNFQQNKLELWVTSLSDNPHLQYYDVQTLEYIYISKLPMKKERIWSNVKETTSHLQNKLTKNIHLGVVNKMGLFKTKTVSSVYMRITTFPIGHIKCYWFKINYLFLSSFYIANIQMWKGQLKSYFIQE